MRGVTGREGEEGTEVRGKSEGKRGESGNSYKAGSFAMKDKRDEEEGGEENGK